MVCEWHSTLISSMSVTFEVHNCTEHDSSILFQGRTGARPIRCRSPRPGSQNPESWRRLFRHRAMLTVKTKMHCCDGKVEFSPPSGVLMEACEDRSWIMSRRSERRKLRLVLGSFSQLTPESLTIWMNFMAPLTRQSYRSSPKSDKLCILQLIWWSAIRSWWSMLVYSLVLCTTNHNHANKFLSIYLVNSHPPEYLYVVPNLETTCALNLMRCLLVNPLQACQGIMGSPLVVGFKGSTNFLFLITSF